MVAVHPAADVVVIGGGPAGSTVATLLAQKGISVQLFERDRFPRFHVGESLIPYTYDVIGRLNLLDRMKGSHFVRKQSVQFVNEHGRLSEPFYFGDYDAHERSQTWQVRRSEFDQLLLDNARSQGVHAYEETRVLEVLFEGDRAAGVRVKGADGAERVVSSQVVVDASGQSSLILDRLGLREWDPDLKKAAIWTYYQGGARGEGRSEGGTIVLQTHEKKGWFWYIPLHDDIVSVGVVAGHEYLFEGRGTKDLGTIFEQELARCPGLGPLLANATRIEPLRAQKEYSYRSRKAAGDGWVLVGDAYGFLDPLYSSGVLLALASGAMAADAIGDALAVGDPSEARLRRWEEDYVRGMNRMRRLVCAFYDGLSFAKLVRKHPDKKSLITDLLVGKLFDESVDSLWPCIDELEAEERQAMATA
jgi:flavin-dependent dehydrogenase